MAKNSLWYRRYGKSFPPALSEAIISPKSFPQTCYFFENSLKHSCLVQQQVICSRKRCTAVLQTCFILFSNGRTLSNVAFWLGLQRYFRNWKHDDEATKGALPISLIMVELSLTTFRATHQRLTSGPQSAKLSCPAWSQLESSRDHDAFKLVECVCVVLF